MDGKGVGGKMDCCFRLGPGLALYPFFVAFGFLLLALFARLWIFLLLLWLLFFYGTPVSLGLSVSVPYVFFGFISGCGCAWSLLALVCNERVLARSGVECPGVLRCIRSLVWKRGGWNSLHFTSRGVSPFLLLLHSLRRPGALPLASSSLGFPAIYSSSFRSPRQSLSPPLPHTPSCHASPTPAPPHLLPLNSPTPLPPHPHQRLLCKPSPRLAASSPSPRPPPRYLSPRSGLPRSGSA